MTPKFSKADAYRTDKIIVSLCNEYEGQHIIKDMEKIGEYEEQNYWNCFDIYEANGVRFFYGNGVAQTNNFSTELLNKYGKQINEIDGWTEDAINKRKEIVKQFCESIKKGIHDPSPIKNWSQFKKNLVQQMDFFPEKSAFEVAKILTDKWVVKEAKEEINSKLQAAMLENQRDCAGFYQSDKTDKDKLDTTLMFVYRQEKDRQLQRDQKKLEKSYEISR